jgi:ubiquinone/menaquinone biosynthesis C-methylase UbiE
VSGRWLPGVHPAPNIQEHPELYEIENRAADPDRRIERVMWELAPWSGEVVLDVGAGTGFHLERFAQQARHVLAVEPDDRSRLMAMRRVADLGLERVSVLTGSAERLLLADRSVGLAHARFAYFFGPGCEPGLAELARVLRPGGTAFVVDNDWRSGTFASWLARSAWCSWADPDRIEGFWRDQGFASVRVESEWRFQRREDLEAVLGVEFPPLLAEELRREHPGTSVDVHYRIYHRRF